MLKLPEVKLVETPSFPEHLYHGEGTEFLVLPKAGGQKGNQRHFMIQHGNQTVGAITIDPVERQLKNLFISPDFRRRGLGAAALQAAESQAKKLKCERGTFYVLAANSKVRSWAKRAGWRQSEEPLVDLGTGSAVYEFGKIFGGVTARRMSRASKSWRRWKPVPRFCDTRTSSPPQKSMIKAFEKELLKRGGAEYAFWLPTFAEADESASNAIEQYAPENRSALLGTEEREANAVRQQIYPFKPNEVRKAMKRILRIREAEVGVNPLVVYAGYIGRFSRILKDSGFNVVHTDALPEHAKAEDMRSIAAPSHKLPIIPNAEAYVSFEGIPALIEQHGMITFLRALSETRKGLVIVSHYDTTQNPTERQLVYLSEAYGLGLEDLLTSNLLFTRIHANPKAKQKIVRDFEVLRRLEPHQPSYKPMLPAGLLMPGGLSRGEIKPDETRVIPKEQITRVAADMGLTEKAVLRSLKRLQCAWLFGSAFEHKE